jgi:hypothetical protein
LRSVSSFRDEDLAELDRRSAALAADGEGIPPDQVAAWMRSRGTAQELPCPKPRRSKFRGLRVSLGRDVYRLQYELGDGVVWILQLKHAREQ